MKDSRKPTGPTPHRRPPARWSGLRRGITRTGLLLCGCLLLGLLPACTDGPAMKQAGRPTAEQLAEFAQHTGIVFPAAAVPLLWHEERGMDDALFVKAVVPPEAFAALLAGPPFAGTELSGPGDFPDATLLYFADWMPRRPGNFRFCQLQLPDARAMNCVFDFDDPQTTVVYLMWFET